MSLILANSFLPLNEALGLLKMASARSLREFAKNSLTPFMQENEFELIKGLSYIKYAPDDMIYFVDCHASRWGNVRFDVGVYVPELDYGERNDLLWPKAMRSLVGGNLHSEKPMLKYIENCWDFEKSPEKTIQQVQDAIVSFAFPLFRKITNRNKMIHSIDIDWWKWEKDEELVNRILSRSPNESLKQDKK